MKRTIIEVAPAKGGGWHAKQRHNGKAFLVNGNKAHIISAARRRARDLGHTQVIIKTSDGKNQIEYTYDKGPKRYPG